MKFVCNRCHKEFKQLAELTQHYELEHNQPQPLEVITVCPMCGHPLTELVATYKINKGGD